MRLGPPRVSCSDFFCILVFPILLCHSWAIISSQRNWKKDASATRQRLFFIKRATAVSMSTMPTMSPSYNTSSPDNDIISPILTNDENENQSLKKQGSNDSKGTKEFALSLEKNKDCDYYSLSFLQQQSSLLLMNDCPPKLCLAIAGGGGHALSTIASTPGASKLLLEGTITYDRCSFQSYVGATLPDTFSFSSLEAGRMLSQKSLLKAMQLRALHDHATFTDILNCVGVGAASTLATTMPTKNTNGRKSRGAIVTSCANGRQVATEFTLNSSQRNRFEQDVLCSNLIVQSIQEAAHQNNIQKSNTDSGTSKKSEEETLLHENEDYATQTAYTNSCNNNADLVQMFAEQILSGHSSAVVLIANGQNRTFDALAYPVVPKDCLLFPGSFNPPHSGHIELAEAAVRRLSKTRTGNSSSSVEKRPVLFELSIWNADKPAMDPTQVSERVSKFWDVMESTSATITWGILLTRAPLFADKVEVLRRYNQNVLLPPVSPISAFEEAPQSPPKWAFVIGTDTMVRVLNPKYYGNNTGNMLSALRSMNVRFVVGGRLEQNEDKNGKFVTGREELQELPSDVQDYFTLVEEKDFRVDISSTELRRKEQQK